MESGSNWKKMYLYFGCDLKVINHMIDRTILFGERYVTQISKFTFPLEDAVPQFYQLILLIIIAVKNN